MPDAVNRYSCDSLPKEEFEPVAAFQRHASWRKPRRKTEAAETIVSADTETVTSHKAAKTTAKESNSVPCSSTGFATTEPLFCELPKSDSSSRQDGKRRRHASASKVKTSSNHRSGLENEPVRFDKSDKISDVVGALKTAGYLRSNELGQSFSKVQNVFL